MQDFLKMDVFFVTTTIVVVLLGIFSLIALYYIIRILRSVDHLAENISEESDDLRTDIGILRIKIRDEGMKLKHFSDLFSNMASRRAKKAGRHRSQSES